MIDFTVSSTVYPTIRKFLNEKSIKFVQVYNKKQKKTSNIVKKFLTLSVKIVINQPPITKLNIHIDYIYLLIDKAKVFEEKKAYRVGKHSNLH